jgi:hypothetical protein
VAEGARLESVYTRKRIEGSNPSLTAKLKIRAFFSAFHDGKISKTQWESLGSSVAQRCTTLDQFFTREILDHFLTCNPLSITRCGIHMPCF